MGRDTPPPCHCKTGSARIGPRTPQKSPRSQVPGPETSPAGILRRVCGSTHLWKEGPILPPKQCGLGVCWGRECWDVPWAQYLCLSPHIPAPPSSLLTLQPASPEASQGTHRVNPGICQLCLAASASPAPAPYEPSWKAASLPAGGAGGWAWEAPRVSRRAPLPQHLQGLNSVGSCCPVGALPELTRTCAMGLYTREHTLPLSLFLSCSNTHRPAHQYLNTVSLYQRKQTHRNPHAQTHRVCVHQSLQLHAHIQIHVSVSYVTQQHTPSHTYRSMSRKSRTHKCKPTPRQICATAPVIAHKATRTPQNYSHIHVPRDKTTCARRHRQVRSRKLSHRAPLPCTSSPFLISHTPCITDMTDLIP